MDGQAYEVPDLTSSGYKLYWSLWKWWRVSCDPKIDCDSPCCLCETLLYLLSLLYPFALVGLTMASSIIYLMAATNPDNYYWRSETKALYFTAFCVLVPTVIGYLITVMCFGYTVFYMFKFTKLVDRNFNLVPRNRVFSNMIYLRNIN